MKKMIVRRVSALILAAYMAGASAAGAHERFRFIGPGVTMDTTAKLLTVTTNDKAYPPAVEIDIIAKTRIERNGKRVTAAQLKPGVFVVVDALGDDALGTEAVLVKIIPPPAR